jgi:hypothetical protein
MKWNLHKEKYHSQSLVSDSSSWVNDRTNNQEIEYKRNRRRLGEVCLVSQLQLPPIFLCSTGYYYHSTPQVTSGKLQGSWRTWKTKCDLARSIIEQIQRADRKIEFF